MSELVNVTEDGTVQVELQGACKGCPMSQMTLSLRIEKFLKERIPEVSRVVQVEDIVFHFSPPFFFIEHKFFLSLIFRIA